MSQTAKISESQLIALRNSLEGELHYDQAMRVLYATDASVYRSLPTAVAYPKSKQDIQTLIAFANEYHVPLIPRAAGTSLAGQVVGKGIVVDISKHFQSVIELNVEEKWVKVQPGVIRDDLNHFLKPYGLYFGPETSTANRAMMGGMVGNNSCGTNSIVYGSTRDHLLALECILSDGSEVTFKDTSWPAFDQKCQGDALENQLYQFVNEKLSDPSISARIKKEFPKTSIHRRNTGYALDLLLRTRPFNNRTGRSFNFCQLLAGSEGTLAFTTAIKLNLVPLPPKDQVLVCAHFESVEEALKGVLVAMQHQPIACELMDKIVLDCTKDNIAQQKNRFFVKGDPQAILMIALGGDSQTDIDEKADALEYAFYQANMGYHFPRAYGKDIKKAWTLRKAGLGLLANIPGDAKPVAVIEDTAVELADLPAYIHDVAEMMEGFGQRSVYYAHAGAGELHLRPILDLKKTEGRKMFRDIGRTTAELVKKYNGSLSGEHGDGRVRAEFLPIMIGQENYELLKDLKAQWDPNNIFNPGKIVDALPMDEEFRYEAEQKTEQFDTIFDFGDTDGILRMAEKCNGSGDCRKTHLSGGTMCPSYMATRNEKDTTRARANILREFLTRSNQSNKFAHEEIKEVMDLCLSCKGCKSECPSNVDVATLKAEFLHHYYQENGVPIRARLFGNINRLNQVSSRLASVNNFFLSKKWSSNLIKKQFGIALERSLPLVSNISLRRWYKKHQSALSIANPKGRVIFFCDEFTNYNDTQIGIKALQLLNRLGYEVIMPPHDESGRAALSKGLLLDAKKHAIANVNALKDWVNEETPLIGIEPSAILTFRDEYLRLVPKSALPAAQYLAKHSMMIEEFIYQEMMKGKISPSQFTKETRYIKLHGHCHQKALSSVDYSAWVLGLPTNYLVEVVHSGCCGMAGSFGYEEEHYELSMQVGELVLFPAVREARKETIIAAPGTSCRHQIHDGTKREALHPVEVLWGALV